MKKILLIVSIIILFTTISIVLFLNIKINNNIEKNNEIINKYENIYTNPKIELESLKKLPQLEINNIDYVGFLNMNNNLLLPIESNCNNSIFDIKSACMYSKDSLIIMATTLKDSITNYKLYDVDDNVIFTNMNGYASEYKISEVKHINSLDKISKYKGDLIIVIKNYYSIEYILFICNK